MAIGHDLRHSPPREHHPARPILTSYGTSIPLDLCPVALAKKAHHPQIRGLWVAQWQSRTWSARSVINRPKLGEEGDGATFGAKPTDDVIPPAQVLVNHRSPFFGFRVIHLRALRVPDSGMDVIGALDGKIDGWSLIREHRFGDHQPMRHIEGDPEIRVALKDALRCMRAVEHPRSVQFKKNIKSSAAAALEHPFREEIVLCVAPVISAGVQSDMKRLDAALRDRSQSAINLVDMGRGFAVITAHEERQRCAGVGDRRRQLALRLRFSRPPGFDAVVTLIQGTGN